MKKKFSWVILTILLGSLGSGLWDLAVKPVFFALWDTSLNVVTLGLSSLKNAIYIDVAKGFYERPSLTIHSLIAGIFLGVIISVILFPRISPSVKGKYSKRITLISELILIFGIVVILLNTSKVFYINRAIGYFEQLINISSPYIEEDKILTFRSRFSQMEKSDDYKLLINEIATIAKENNQKIPKFEPFE